MSDDSGKRHDPGRDLESHRSLPIHSSAIARGLQLSTHFVAVVLVGAAIGWLVDRWLGISPWGMITLLLLGFSAGVFTVMRLAGDASRNRVSDFDRKTQK